MATSDYDQQWLEVIQLENSFGSRPAFRGTVSDMHSQFAAVGQLIGPLFPSPDSSLTARDITLESGLRVRTYTPKKSLTTAKNLPIGVYYHGGGFIMGNLEAEDADCRYFAQNTPCIIVAVDYRHAPEYDFNEILNDALEGLVLNKLSDTKSLSWNGAEELGGKQHCVFPIGASAGGCLALAVTNSLILSGLRSRIRGVVALCPISAHPESIPKDYQGMYTSHLENAKDVPIINKQALEVFFNAAQLNPLDAKSFVTLSKCLKEFPKTWIVTCEKDPLRDDGVVLEKMLSAQDVVVRRKHYNGFGHCFWIFPQLAKREEFLGDVVHGIEFVLEN
ncbi:hypothetical protein CJF30_00009888 [Rutstroemia sp. NJR-2017a BBW]|nr:hypothetical protein CJF30_00009888 [Rutstroemia sp. NJR-2017a BBW]